MYFELIKEDKRLVHKEHDDDVLICNPRGVLPNFLESEYDLSGLAKQDSELFFQYYEKVSGVSIGKTPAYFLRHIPRTMSFESAQRLVKAYAGVVDLIAEYYALHNDQYIIAEKAMTEAHQELIFQFFDGVGIAEYERYRLWAILKQFPDVKQEPIYRATLFNNGKHYFFYRKSHEHVPGMMLMEAARQALYVHFYKFSGYSKGEVALSLLSFDTRFTRFIDSNYPVYIQTENRKCSNNGDDKKNSFFRAKLIQRDILVTVIDVEVSVVKTKIFERMRNLKPDVRHNFVLLDAASRLLVLLILPNGEHVESRFSNIAYERLSVDVATAEFSNSIDMHLRFYIFAPNFGIIKGEGTVAELEKDCGHTSVVINAVKWDAKAERAVREFIKKECYVIESSMHAVQEDEEVSDAVSYA